MTLEPVVEQCQGFLVLVVIQVKSQHSVEARNGIHVRLQLVEQIFFGLCWAGIGQQQTCLEPDQLDLLVGSKRVCLVHCREALNEEFRLFG